ncbi:MAG TPA: AmmeMemoRadiSam system protein B [Planctomycetota bacterium]|nr:AmmeMemoRadiSam system protein B [Planctomycetota bacterium]
MAVPPFRNALRVVPFKHEGRDVFLVQDGHESLFEHQVVLPPLAFVVASFLDGRRDASEVHREILAKFPDSGLGVDDVLRVVQELDDHHLLESEGLQALRRRVEEEFLASPTRPSRFVTGTADEVRAELEGYFAADAGAGTPGERRPSPLPGLMAPHIDFRRGGHCYSFAYRELAERSDADLYVILGVAHMSPPNPFVFTAKSYATPLGPVETDAAALDVLEKRLGAAIYDNEAVHRAEHSAEFQVVFLKHARPSASFTALPILVSTFEPHCGAASPSTVARVEDVLGALREAFRGRRVCVVAGVDFAHVGPVFGDAVEIDQALVRGMVEADARSLKACGEGDPEAFWASVMEDGNKRHVCGLSATYAALRLLDGVEGKLLKYGFAPDPAGGLVSFASMSFAPR